MNKRLAQATFGIEFAACAATGAAPFIGGAFAREVLPKPELSRLFREKGGRGRVPAACLNLDIEFVKVH